MICKGHTSATFEDILSYTNERDIAKYYLGVNTIPIRINSPFREDNNPSFGIFEYENHIFYKDFGNGESGNLYKLLMRLLNLNFRNLMDRIYTDFIKGTCTSYKYRVNRNYKRKKCKNMETRIEVKVRDWRDYDIEYWNSYGCNINLLKYAEVYPISHSIIYKDNRRYTFVCDKYAYVFIERKEGKITKKIYQPYNKNGHKWNNNNNKTIIGLWNTLPKKGNEVIICSSLKDAICIMSNTKIPCIYVQSETTGISDTALKELRGRFENIYISFDGDDSGIRDAKELSTKTGLPVIWCPKIEKAKDWSDIYHDYGKDRFLEEFNCSLEVVRNIYNDLPF